MQIDRNSSKPLYAQIRDTLRQAVESGDIGPGDQLPTVAALAADAGVTQATIRRAYDDLVKAGIVTRQVGRGTFVREAEGTAGPQPAPAPPGPEPAARNISPEFKSIAGRLRSGITDSLNDLLLLRHKPGTISFSTGVPSPDTLPADLLSDMFAHALARGHERYFACHEPQGLVELRSALAERLSRDGLQFGPEHILITNGSQQVISLLAKAAREDGRRQILCETPGYTGLPDAFMAHGHWVDTVARDHEGPLPERLEALSGRGPSLFYLCTELHNPMGTDLSPERRDVVIEWARREEAQVLADEIFRDLRGRRHASALPDGRPGPGAHLYIGLVFQVVNEWFARGLGHLSSRTHPAADRPEEGRRPDLPAADAGPGPFAPGNGRIRPAHRTYAPTLQGKARCCSGRS